MTRQPPPICTPTTDGDRAVVAEFGEYLRALKLVRSYQERPRIVCICGSTRFWPEMAEENVRQTAAGRIVLAPGCDMKRPHPLWADDADAEVLKARLDELHRQKIAFADEIVVVAPGGYVGESTRAEIEYAEGLGLPVTYSPPLDGEARP
ncbi:hypothetical protein [Embleya sp. NPDC001921]